MRYEKNNGILRQREEIKKKRKSKKERKRMKRGDMLYVIIKHFKVVMN